MELSESIGKGAVTDSWQPPRESFLVVADAVCGQHRSVLDGLVSAANSADSSRQMERDRAAWQSQGSMSAEIEAKGLPVPVKSPATVPLAHAPKGSNELLKSRADSNPGQPGLIGDSETKGGPHSSCGGDDGGAMILGQDAGNLTVRDYLTPMGRASPSIRLQTQHGLSEETFNFSGPVWYDRTVRVRTYG
jgi:hypothetical protein